MKWKHSLEKPEEAVEDPGGDQTIDEEDVEEAEDEEQEQEKIPGPAGYVERLATFRPSALTRKTRGMTAT